MYGICNLSVIPCRREPSNLSEMVTQLIFGEHFSVLENNKDGWIRIKTSYDKYECWINDKQFTPISFKLFENLESGTLVYSNEMLNAVTIENLQKMLDKAIEIEDYESAAELRDVINDMKNDK